MTTLAIAGAFGAVASAYLAVPARDGLRLSAGVGDLALVGVSDRVVPHLSRTLDKFYPADVAENLLRKDKMPGFLGLHGFPVLETVRAHCGITMRDFIIKPILGSGCGSWLPQCEALAYRKFNDAAQLADAVRKSGANLRGYVAQSAVMENEHTTASVAGTVNGSGDVLFIRSTISSWGNGFRYKSVRSFCHPELDDAKALLRNFISAQKIRCAAFSLQLIQKGGVYYPMDWNFHIPATYVFDAMRVQPEEFHAVVHHMADVHVDGFCEPGDSWVVDRKEQSNLVYAYGYANNMVKVS